ncbi:MAG: YceD family protein [Microthrixaceae bacterium]|nr:YceD family protein [Microthrixaceae bacterium]
MSPGSGGAAETTDDPEPDGAADGAVAVEAVPGLRFRVLELRRVPGAREHEQLSVQPAPLSVGEVSVVAGPVGVDVDLEVVSGGVRATGSVDFAWQAPCRRCLDRATGREETEFAELFVDDPEGFAGDPEIESEPLPVDDGWIDLGNTVRDAMLLGLPLAPLCDPDCPGPDPEAHPVGLAGSGPGTQGLDDDDRVPDPRWSALSQLDLGGEKSDG